MVHFGNSWDWRLAEEFKKDYYLALRRQLIEEYRRYRIYPDMHDIFNALKWTSYEDVKVVILGQDPYFNPGQAHGLSFSVREGVKLPPSLQNIYKELQRDLSIPMARSGDLSCWARQGVLLLNAILTVRQGAPNSHRHIGWDRFTDEVLRQINEKAEPVVFLLWGNQALRKARFIDQPQHLILKTTHPSPLSASRGFLGCSHFSKTNQFLKEHYETDIDWQVEAGGLP